MKRKPVPNIEDLFVAAIQSSLEAAHLLKLSHDQFMALVEGAWQVDAERMSKETQEGKEK
jgi:uncharacterized protein Yka (UPF0111/DUF47 family)